MRIKTTFKKGKVFVGYLMAGDGGLDKSLQAALALIEGGVNLLEIGMPFSDPVADGPVIEQAATRALAAGTTMEGVLTLVRKLREHTNIPLVLFSYANPIFAACKHDFFAEAKRAGLDGVLVVDCPLEESGFYYKECIKQDLAPIFVITPATPRERIAKIAKAGRGFLYYACRKGTTGIKEAMPEGFAEKIQEIKSVSRLPVVAGFGISNVAMAKEILQQADGFVVGSLFVKALAEGKSNEELTKLANSVTPHLLRGPVGI
jgi:tryptophan synthase alpha chain